MRRTTRAAALVAAVMLVGGVTACGGDDATTSTKAGGSDAVKSFKVGVIPAVDVAPLYLGIQKGFFREEGLDPKPVITKGGAESITGVIGGDFAIAFGASVPLIQARDKGLPVKIIAPGNRAAEDATKPWEALMVKGDGSIKTLKDLEGQTIATNSVKGMTELVLRELLERNGVDVSKVKFTEVPIPDMPASLSSGRIPAVGMSDPFMSVALKDGDQQLTPMFAGLDPGMTVGTYFTVEPTIKKDPDLIARFQRAIGKSSDYAQAHPDEARAIVNSYAQIPAPLLKGLTLPQWGSDLNRPSIQLMADLALKHKYIGKPMDVSQLVAEGAGS
jgi:NitT/TauT family transport system substrate-binding protein